MIKVCPVCRNEEGVTHGDQTWIKKLCERCLDIVVGADIDAQKENAHDNRPT